MALDYLPSPGWAVIYGETPSATRWSELGDNDDALATGAGIDDLAILTRHLANSAVTGAKIANYRVKRQSDTTNSEYTDAIIRTGWGVVNVSTGASQFDETVTFDAAFTNRPVVLAQFAGDGTTNAGTGTGGNIIEATANCKVYDVTTTNFKVKISKPNGANYGGNGFAWYHWIAIGS